MEAIRCPAQIADDVQHLQTTTGSRRFGVSRGEVRPRRQGSASAVFGKPSKSIRGRPIRAKRLIASFDRLRVARRERPRQNRDRTSARQADQGRRPDGSENGRYRNHRPSRRSPGLRGDRVSSAPPNLRGLPLWGLRPSRRWVSSLLPPLPVDRPSSLRGGLPVRWEAAFEAFPFEGSASGKSAPGLHIERRFGGFTEWGKSSRPPCRQSGFPSSPKSDSAGSGNGRKSAPPSMRPGGLSVFAEWRFGRAWRCGQHAMPGGRALRKGGAFLP